MLGSEYVRAYMHGYFIDVKLYNKVKAIADPNAFENYRKEALKKKIEERAKHKIHTYAKQQPTQKKQEEEGTDKRFDAIFTDPEFGNAPAVLLFINELLEK